MKKSRIVLVLCMMVVIAVASVAGTIAWLTDTTEPVTNTFTPTDIDITLAETEANWSKQLSPGVEYAKDPKVTVEGSDKNVDIYLFVKVVENDCATYLDYELNLEGWTALGTANPGVYYREVAASTEDQSWYLLKGTTTNANGAVTVKSTLQKADEDASTLSMPAANLEMEFTAYAIQKAGFNTAALAWAEVSK